MSNLFKTTVEKLSELPCSDLRDLFTWPSGGSTIQADNPNVLVAKAANDSGETIAFVTAEPILLVDGYVFSPNSTDVDAQRAGNDIDKALAERAGVQRMWVVIPDEAPPMRGERRIRVFERQVASQPATMQVGCATQKAAVGYLN